MLGILHEEQFSVPKAARNAERTQMMLRSECAWPAAPFANLLLSQGARVVHLVRNPATTIASLAERQLFNRESHVTEAFIRQYVAVPHVGTHLEHCAHLWYLWNMMLEQYDLPRIRIEDIGNAPRKHVGPKVEPIKRGDLEDKKLWNQIVDLGRRYGYTLQ